jgi:hypothetical protein
LRSQLSHAVAERSIASAAEARAAAALKDAMGDRDRYSRLVDSLQSLEAGAAGRAEAERAAFEDERERLQVSAERLVQWVYDLEVEGLSCVVDCVH